jgi:hypothetical protein
MLVGLHGKKQAGKDTVYARMVHLLGGQGATVERVSFADKLYESAAASLGVSVDFLRNWKADPGARVEVVTLGNVRRSLTFREYLQHYGTEAHRDTFGADFWVEQADLSHEGRVVVVTDCRFANEAQAILDAGGAIVHVIGPDEVELAGDGHASEEKLPDRFIDLELPNVVRDDDFKALDAEVLGAFLRLRREGY